MNDIYVIDKVFDSAFAAYSQVKSMLVLEAVQSLVAGIILTFIIFKVLSVLKDSLSEGKGFSGKHFFELTKQYMMCISVIVSLPIIIHGTEKVFSYTAQNLVEKMITDGEYKSSQLVTDIAKELVADCEDLSFTGILMDDPLTAVKVYIISTVGAIAAWLFDYITFIFIASRYLILLLLEIIAPVAVVCVLYDDTRNSFYTWLKSLFACYMLYPGLIIASLFADQIVMYLYNHDRSQAWILLLFGLSLKTSLLATVKSTISKWL